MSAAGDDDRSARGDRLYVRRISNDTLCTGDSREPSIRETCTLSIDGHGERDGRTLTAVEAARNKEGVIHLAGQWKLRSPTRSIDQPRPRETESDDLKTDWFPGVDMNGTSWYVSIRHRGRDDTRRGQWRTERLVGQIILDQHKQFKCRERPKTFRSRTDLTGGTVYNTLPDLYHVMPCWPWYVPLSSARWITATQFLPACPGIFMIGCSQFSTPPPVWCSRPGGTTTSPHCSGTFTGCASRSVSSSGYVCWSTGVCTARHRRTSPMTSSWLPLSVPAVNSGLLTLRLWWSGLPDARRSATAHFPWQLPAPGTASRQLLGTRRHYLPSEAAWRHGCLNWHWRDTDLILRLHFTSFRFSFFLF